MLRRTILRGATAVWGNLASAAPVDLRCRLTAPQRRSNGAADRIGPASAGSIDLRPAAAGDDWAVRGLFVALHSHNATLDPLFALADGWETTLDEHLARIREDRAGITLLAWRASEPVGLLMMDSHVDSPLFRFRRWVELLALYVAPPVRGTGLADRLLRVGVAWAHARGAARVQLYVTASNEPARRFYARGGFRPVQEIWRLDLGRPAPGGEPDAGCEAVHASGHHLLSPTQHRLADEIERDQPA